MFQIGEYVVYGMNGVCTVEEIGPMNLNGLDESKDYYTLKPLYTKGSRVFTPVDNQKVVMRPILSKADVCKLIDEMPDIELIDVENDKNRELTYREAWKSCDCRRLIQIIKTITNRREKRLAQGKKMSACDERYLKQAKDSLYGEFAISLGIDKSEVEDFIEKRKLKREMVFTY